MRLDHSDCSDDIHCLLRYELQKLNQQAGVHFIRQTPIESKKTKGIFHWQWTSNKGSSILLYSWVLIDNVLFLSLSSKNCADRNANHHVHIWSSQCAKQCGGQGQVPHSSAKVLACNSCQAGSHEQSITASHAHRRLTYQENRVCVEEFLSMRNSQGVIENHWSDCWRGRSNYRVVLLEKIVRFSTALKRHKMRSKMDSLVYV